MTEATSLPPGKRAWHGTAQQGGVQTSRQAWRWIFSLLALALVIAAVLWAWPKPLPRTLLLTLSADREDRNIIPPVPYLTEDLAALRQWADAADVPICQLKLSQAETAQRLIGDLIPAAGQPRSGSAASARRTFTGKAAPAGVWLRPIDTLVLYVKAHGIALHFGDAAAFNAEPQATGYPRPVGAEAKSNASTAPPRPLLLKSLADDDLAAAWFTDPARTLDVASLLAELAQAHPGPKIVIFDAVHFNYDPRLGMLANAFPQAVLQSLPKADNLWVVLAGGDGEIAVGRPIKSAPGTFGRSAFVDGLLAGLRQDKDQKRSLDLAAILDRTKTHLSSLQTGEPSGIDAFCQTPRLLGPPAPAPVLPLMPHMEEEKKTEQQPAEKRAAAPLPANASPIRTLAQALRQSSFVALQQSAPQSAPAPAAPSSNAEPQAKFGPEPKATAAAGTPPAPAAGANRSSAGADTNQPQPGSAAGTTIPPAGPSDASSQRSPGSESKVPSGSSKVPAAPPVAETLDQAFDELHRAWQLRDKIQSPGDAASGADWSPIHFAPHWWRRLEGLLVGFDERLVLGGPDERVDPQTLRQMRTDLEALDRLLSGGGGQLPRGRECSQIAAAFAQFRSTSEAPGGSSAWASFHPRRSSGLADANAALKAFSRAVYRLPDYIRLHGLLACVPDGGPNYTADLDELLRVLLDARRRAFNPATLDEGRLDDGRVQELKRLRSDLERLTAQIDAAIAQYARAAASGPITPGKMLRLRLLLASPTLAASDRLLHWQAAAGRSKETANLPPASGPVGSARDRLPLRLAANLRWTQSLLQLVAADDRTTPSQERPRRPAEPASAALWRRFADARYTSSSLEDPSSWTRAGRDLRELGESLPGDIAARSIGFPLPPVELFDLYLRLLLVDGREAGRVAPQPPITLAQPLRPERLLDHVQLALEPELLPLSLDDRREGALLRVRLGVTSERPPPYEIDLDLSWTGLGDIRLLRQGQELQPGTLRLALDKPDDELSLRVIPLRTREGTLSSRISISAKASFGQAQQANVPAAPAAASAVCVLPGPDEVELRVVTQRAGRAADPTAQDLEGGDQGGRLLLFPNRSSSFLLFLRNQSSEDKELHARLYRVPPWAGGGGGRLFNPRSPRELLPRAADMDRRIKAAAPDIWQQLQEFLIAQTDEKTPLKLPAEQSGYPLAGAVAVPLISAARPPPAPAAPAAPPPLPAAIDCTDGLLLVLTSAAQPPGTRERAPYVKWIELRPHQPDDILEIRQPSYRDGRLSFFVALKRPEFAAAMGLAQQPLKIQWDRRCIPGAQGGVAEALLTAESHAAELSAMLLQPPVGRGATADNVAPRSLPQGPLVLQLHVDGFPRGLMALLEQDLKLVNLKKDRLPLVHLGKLNYAKSIFLIQSRRPRLPLPVLVQPAEGVRIIPIEREDNEPLALAISDTTYSAAVSVDVQAEVGLKYFELAGAQIRLAVDGNQEQSFLSDRRFAAQFSVEGGGIKLDNSVADFVNVALRPVTIEPGQDRRLEIALDVTNVPTAPGDNIQLDPEAGVHRLTVIFDRNPPVVDRVEARPASIVQLPGPPITLTCWAGDGASGCGVRQVQFFVDSDASGRIDEPERAQPILARELPGTETGYYYAEYRLPPTAKNGQYLVEAVAIDGVGHASPPARGSFIVRVVPTGVSDRTTFGGAKKDEPPKRP